MNKKYRTKKYRLTIFHWQQQRQFEELKTEIDVIQVWIDNSMKKTKALQAKQKIMKECSGTWRELQDKIDQVLKVLKAYLKAKKKVPECNRDQQHHKDKATELSNQDNY